MATFLGTKFKAHAWYGKELTSKFDYMETEECTDEANQKK